MTHAYVSLLSTDSYLPGVLTLHHSLRRTGSTQPFLLLIRPSVSAAARELLARQGIETRIIAGGGDRLHELEHGSRAQTPDGEALPARWNLAWGKLHVFDLTDFERVVYVDSDMLIHRNIDELFTRPHMSAVNAGGMLPEHASWVQLNSGLLVVEPSAELFADMMRTLTTTSHGCEHDQAFLQYYYPDWPARPELHLDHSYNMFDISIDRYHELFGYRIEDVHVFHYIGTKPWAEAGALTRWRRRAAARARRLLRGDAAVTTGPLREAAHRLWLECYRDLDRTGGAAYDRP